MEQYQLEAMREIQKEMVERKLNVEELSRRMFSKGVITQDDLDNFNSKVERTAKIICLIDAVMNKGDANLDSFAIFSEELKNVKFGWLAEKLHTFATEFQQKLHTKPSLIGFDKDNFRLHLTEIIIPKCESIQRQWQHSHGLRNADLHKAYQPLEMCETDARNSETKLTQTFHELLVKQTAKKVILIEGDPGVGKTTFINKLAQEWAASTSARHREYLSPEYCTDVHRENVKLLKNNFDFVFLIPLRTLETNSIVSHMEKVVNQHSNNENALRVVEFLLKNTRTMLLLDGYDEKQPTDIKQLLRGKIRIENEILVGCKIVITIRSYFVKRFPSLHEINPLWLRIKGFSVKTLYKYFEAHSVDVSDIRLLYQFYNQLLYLCQSFYRRVI